MDQHLQKGLVADPFAFRYLAGFSEIERGQSERNLYAALTAQVGYERRALLLLGNPGARLLFEKLSPLRACPPFRCLVFVP